jgi:dienelactone hydrolase
VLRYLSGLAGVPAPTVRTNSCVDAEILDGAYPVVVFTHAYTGMFTDYTFLFEDLASRGYVVGSIGHTYESTAVSFPDGRFARSVLGTLLTTAPIDERTISLVESVRLEDVSFVVDELARLNARSDSPLAGHLDTASIAIAGHSLGGLTALQAITREPRIRAAVVLDGVAIDGDTWLTDTPVLVLDAGREQWSADERQLWGRLRGPRFAINLKDAAHAAPSDLVWIAKGAVATGSMTSEQAVAATRDYVAAFLDVSLQGKPVDPLLVRTSKRYPHVEVKGSNPIGDGNAL